MENFEYGDSVKRDRLEIVVDLLSFPILIMNQTVGAGSPSRVSTKTGATIALDTKPPS